MRPADKTTQETDLKYNIGHKMESYERLSSPDGVSPSNYYFAAKEQDIIMHQPIPNELYYNVAY